MQVFYHVNRADILLCERADILLCERAKFICGFIVCESDHSESISSSSDGFERCDILSRERAGFTENTPVESGPFIKSIW